MTRAAARAVGGPVQADRVLAFSDAVAVLVGLAAGVDEVAGVICRRVHDDKLAVEPARAEGCLWIDRALDREGEGELGHPIGLT